MQHKLNVMPKYNSIENIPAPVFFKILETKNYQLLKPKPKEKGLEVVFMAIYDDFFVKSGNNEAQEYLKLTVEIAKKEYSISIIKQTLFLYTYNKVTKEMREDYAKMLKDEFSIEINPDEKFVNEVKKILEFNIGFMINDLQILKMELSDITKNWTNDAYNYYADLLNLESVHKRQLNIEMPLIYFIECKKQAQKIVIDSKKMKI